MEDQREVSAYKEVMMSAFADFSGLDERELRVGLGGARALLDAGGPLSPARLARAVEVPLSQVNEILRRHAKMGFVYFDGQGRVAAMWAVGGIDAGHRIEVDGKAGPTWCALDTLLLPVWWQVSARVTSRDPLTGLLISFSVGPGGVADLEPAEAVVSAYEPEGQLTQDVRASFCEFVNFFESAQSAGRWAERQEGRRFRFLRIETAFAWAQDYMSSTFRARSSSEVPGGDPG
jgi:hypothetical protein